jgi:hypothetical protein
MNMQVPIDGKETPTNKYQMMRFPTTLALLHWLQNFNKWQVVSLELHVFNIGH